MVIAKVGKPTERSKPGNRGKRDSQILLLHYLNRVHFDLPMSPLELEIYHQMRNVIGIDPAFYEYIFTVDADTVCPHLFIETSLCVDHPFFFCSYRLLPRTLSTGWSRSRRMILGLSVFAARPS